MTNEAKAKEKIIDRIRKLLALSQSPNENEAAAAAEKAQAMLAEHNLALSDVAEKGAKEKEDITVEEGGTTWSHPWRRFLANAVASLYFCKYYYVRRTPYKESPYDVHHFVGARHNVAVAKLMFAYLTQTVERLADEGMKKVPAKERWPYRTSFRNACSLRLCHRINERIEAAKAGEVQLEGGKNLPALLGLYDKWDAANTEFLNENVGEMKSKAARIRSNHVKGTLDGDEAGRNIGLDGQVKRDDHARIR